MRINGIKTALVAVSIAISAQILSCQSLPLPAYETALMDGEASHADYDFQAAVQFYSEALRKCRDTSRIPEIERRLSQSRNGRAMAGYCQKPKVVARKNFSLKEFFLYYPLADRSWRPAPNRLDTLGGIFSPVTWFPRGSKEAYWSMPDTAGVRNIYYARDLGTRWSSPYKMPFSSTEDEIFPMVSGGKLYFASKGLFGVGGYDIYVCERRADGRWGEPRNLGFPYSSPYDDFLFVNTPDGRYSIFASNRDCSIDSVSVYVIEREINPVSSAVSNVRDLRRLCRLDPPRDLKKVDNKSAMSASKASDPNTELYARKAAEVRRLREEISRVNRELSTLRSFYNSATTATDREEMQDKIVKKEARLPGLQSQLVAANKDLQKTEMDFLLHGVLIDRSRVEAESDNEVVGVESSYTFTRRSLGSSDF
jgi:hypothetical protein